MDWNTFFLALLIGVPSSLIFIYLLMEAEGLACPNCGRAAVDLDCKRCLRRYYAHGLMEEVGREDFLSHLAKGQDSCRDSECEWCHEG